MILTICTKDRINKNIHRGRGLQHPAASWNNTSSVCFCGYYYFFLFSSQFYKGAFVERRLFFSRLLLTLCCPASWSPLGFYLGFVCVCVSVCRLHRNVLFRHDALKNDSSHLCVCRLGPLTKATITSPLSRTARVCMCCCVCVCLNVFTGFMCLVMVCLCVTVSVGVHVCFSYMCFRGVGTCSWVCLS